MAKQNKNVDNRNSIYEPKTPKTIKRFAAWFIDIILIIVVATGIALFTSMIYGYDNYNNICHEKEIQYEVYVENAEGTLEFNDKKYILCTELEGISDEEATARYAALYQDNEYKEAYSKRSVGQVIVITSGIVGSLLIFELIVPLILKHGRTIGMKFFDIGYVTDDGIDVDFKTVFVRFLFGKLVVGALIPYSGLMLSIMMPTEYTVFGLIALIGVPVLNLLLLYSTPEKRGIHDFLAKCVPCDNSCQIYFDNVEDLIKAKAEEKRNKTEKKIY